MSRNWIHHCSRAQVFLLLCETAENYFVWKHQKGKKAKQNKTKPPFLIRREFGHLRLHTGCTHFPGLPTKSHHQLYFTSTLSFYISSVLSSEIWKNNAHILCKDTWNRIYRVKEKSPNSASCKSSVLSCAVINLMINLLGALENVSLQHFFFGGVTSNSSSTLKLSTSSSVSRSS